MSCSYKTITIDVLVIGTGGAGIRAGIAAHEQGVNVILVSKGQWGLDGATIAAEADMAIDSRSCNHLFGLSGDKQDSPELFLEDIIRGGEYLNNQELVEVHVNEAPSRLAELLEWGVDICELVHTPGHRFPRGVWMQGRQLMTILKRKVRSLNIRVMDYLMVTHLFIEKQKVVGALALDLLEGVHIVFQTKAVVLATGGATRVYPYSTGSECLTGDGMTLAFDAGAELADMEFPMFLPYTILSPKAAQGIPFTHDLTNYLDTHALNKMGFRYMSQWDSINMERSTRDINSVAAGVEIDEGRGSPGGGVWLSLSHLPSNLVLESAKWFPESLRNWQYGYFDLKTVLPDLTRDAIETVPAAHFWNGGIRIDKNGSTNVSGLFAAGEGTAGIHGANRISGNAITQIFVWGYRAGKGAALFADESENLPLSKDLVERAISENCLPLSLEDGISPFSLASRVREVAWQYLGIIRDQDNLLIAKEEIIQIQQLVERQVIVSKRKQFNREWFQSLQNRSMVRVLALILKSALFRDESRGSHYRKDHPDSDDKNWICNIILKKDLNSTLGIKNEEEEVIFRHVNPIRQVRPYGRKCE